MIRNGTLLLMSLLLMSTSGEALAQRPTDLGTTPQVQTQNNPVAKLADLEVGYVGLTPAGTVVYQVVNKGGGGGDQPFAVDIYLNGALKDTIRHEPLPAMTMQTVQSNLARVSDCQEMLVRVVVDSQHSVRESDRRNNERSAKLSLPCPKIR